MCLVQTMLGKRVSLLHCRSQCPPRCLLSAAALLELWWLLHCGHLLPDGPVLPQVVLLVSACWFVALAKLVVVVVGLAGYCSCLTGRCCTSSCRTHCLGHTIGMFHPGSVPAVSLSCCTPLFGNPLPSGPVDHICSILLLDSFLFLCCELLSTFLCFLSLLLLADTIAVVFLCPFLCCNCRSLRSLFLVGILFLCDLLC